MPALWACGTNAPDIPDELADAIAKSAAGGASGGYPSGPYGAADGDTVGDLCFDQVWDNPLEADYDHAALKRLCFSDFFDPDGTKGNVILLVNTGALWCTACSAEWEGLPREVGERAERGLRALGLFFEDLKHNPIDADGIEAWARAHKITVPFGADPDFEMRRYADRDRQPFNMLIDTANMTILEQFETGQPAPIMARIDSELAARGK